MVANVREVFELLEFDNVLKNFRTLDEARGAFGVSTNQNSVKKKEFEIGRLEIIEAESGTNGNHLTGPEAGGGEDLARELSPVEHLLIDSIEKDPFMSIREMVQHVNNLSDTTRVGWWKVFRLLKKNNLLSKRSRFRLAKNQLDSNS
jgi:hypothetical protein